MLPLSNVPSAQPVPPKESQTIIPDLARPRRGRVLVVDDERNIRSTLHTLLTEEGYDTEVAACGDSAELCLAKRLPDAILLDVRLPGRDGVTCLKQWRATYAAIPVILMSGEATITEALEGLQHGAYDFIEKPFLTARLLKALERALEKLRLSEAAAAQDQGEGAIIGASLSLRRVLADVAKVAPTKSRVLITGESGTGKDLLARALHEGSPRRGARFVKINCAAIPAELIESELFGHVKGAFTGAHAARRGHFELADGGTLFLDEIGDLSLNAQAKILRALQNGEITPVGGSTTLSVDVRVVAATNRDLKAAVANGQFREDLYYRLAVVTLHSPPLRERGEDLPLLAAHFVRLTCRENGLPERSLPAGISAALAASTSHYAWPGNIRELRNIIERLVILGDSELSVDDLPPELFGPHSRPKVSGASAWGASSSGAVASFSDLSSPPSARLASWAEFKQSSERSYLLASLRATGGNISETARLLEVERSTIHKWLKAMAIERSEYA